MEKLIELLNEYQYWMFVYEDDLLLLRIWSHVKVWGETFVISKKFWFIKWLVENNKIDTDIVYEKWFLAKTYDKDEVWEYFEPYEEILMLLSIQDEPIEFLVSILK